jgi:two-component system, NarL family, nitrate/nitrite response regulator NarL
MVKSIPQRIRVFLVKDEAVTREGLRLLLNSQPGITVVGEVSNCREAIAAVMKDQPDIILIDIDLGDERGLTFIQDVRRAVTFAQVIILTGADNLEIQLSAISRGAKGLVRKSETSDVLVQAIKKVHAGEVWLDGMLMARVLNEMWFLLGASQSKVEIVNPDHITGPGPEAVKVNGTTNGGLHGAESAKIALLTEREREIVGLIGRGLRNKEIADRLFISVVTVRHHLSSIFDKLEVSDRFGLAIYAFRYGLAEIPYSTNMPDAK